MESFPVFVFEAEMFEPICRVSRKKLRWCKLQCDRFNWIVSDRTDTKHSLHC